MAAVGHQAGFAIAADLAGDQAELQLAAVFVVLALDRLDGDHDTRQAAVGIHRLEARRQPGVSHRWKAWSTWLWYIWPGAGADRPPRRPRALSMLVVHTGSLMAWAARSPRRAGVSGSAAHSRERSCRRRCGDQDAIRDAQGGEQARQDEIGLDLHVVEAGLAGPRLEPP